MSDRILGEGEIVNFCSLGAKVLAPLVAGAALGTVTMFGLVYSQTQAPSSNPAEQQVLVYGDR